MSLIEQILLYFFMLIATALCFATIYFQNPVNAVLSFIGVFIISASFLLYLGVEFLAITYLVVYIGAVAVLFLFIVMLLNAYTQYDNFKFNAWIAAVLGSFMLGNLISIYRHFKNSILELFFMSSERPVDSWELPTINTAQWSICDEWTLQFENSFYNVNENEINFAYKVNPNTLLWAENDIHLFGGMLYSSHSVLFLVLTLALLVALVGVIVLTLHKPQQTRI